MTTSFTATAGAEQFSGFHFSQAFSLAFNGNGTTPGFGGAPIGGHFFQFSFADPLEPYDGFYENFGSSPAAFDLLNLLSGDMSLDEDSSPQFLAIASFFDKASQDARFTLELFDDTSVDYSFSNAPIFVDLEAPVQMGGFAQGDVLTDIFEVTGSFFNDVIRGSNPADYPPDTTPIFVNGQIVQKNLFFTINNPGDNILVGGGGDDVLEGRGGADILVGGSLTADFGFDFASYESSPAAVTVRLPGVFADTTPGIASGGDAQATSWSASRV